MTDEKPRPRRLPVWTLVSLTLLFAFLGLRLYLSAPISSNGTSPEVLRQARFPQRDPNLDLRGLISIHSPSDVTRIRDELTALVWGGAGLPARAPEVRDLALDDPLLAGLRSVTRAEGLRVEMEFGLESLALHLDPSGHTTGTMIYHQGHGRGLEHDVEQVQHLLDQGLSVVYFDMPLYGHNNRPQVPLADGRQTLQSHAQIGQLPVATGHPLKLFLEPVIVVVNHLAAERGDSPLWMTGISGGGWTTTLIAALDPRITLSFPVAGSQPSYARLLARARNSDWEQEVPEVYEIANYLELYVLGAYGVGEHGEERRQLQILNEFDPCCFRSKEYRQYQPIVGEVLRELGAGSFGVFMDDSHREHQISAAALERILSEIESAAYP